jgi:hypothetical protein
LSAILLPAIVILLVIGALIYVFGSKDRYSEMSEEEYEAEVKDEQKSLLGAGMVGLNKALMGGQIDQVIEQKQRVEKDATPSGEPPSEE